MKLGIAYKIVKTWSKLDKHFNYEVVASEFNGQYVGDPTRALEYARALADEYALYGSDCKSHPELDIIAGDDKLEISVYPVILADGVEVETDTRTQPIQTLRINALALEHYSEMDSFRDLYNYVNTRSRDAFTSLY